MPRFFVPTDNFDGDIVSIFGEDARHVSRSLRMAKGECITVCDMKGYEYECVLEEFIDDTEVRARILDKKKSENEPPYAICVYQGSPKGDKLEYIVQKAVELGAARIVPFLSERCISRPDKKSGEKKALRLSKIAHEAAKQSGRAVCVEVGDFCSFESALEAAKDCELKLFFYEGDGTEPLPSVLASYRKEHGTPANIAIFIGSEGGFSLSECERAKEYGFTLCGLGSRILRTETASGCVLSCLMYEFELSK